MAGRGVDLTWPAWMTAAGQQQAAAPGSGQPGSMALALVDQPPNQDLYDLSDYDSSDSENQDDFLPPGPLEAEKCTLSGPGFTGGAAGSPVSFVITAKDGRGKRIRDGGAYVRVQVQPMRGVNAEPVDPSIKDHGDGSYTVTYAVSARGNYELSIELNGSPIGGNPFPVYFSPPDKNAASPAPAAETAAPPNASTVTSAAIAAAGAVSAGLSGAQQTTGADGQSQSLATLGAQAHAAGVLFPSDDDTLHRTILIANINPLVNTEQVKQLFGFCGQVKSCRMVGNNQFAFVEYSSPGEANAAMGLNGQMLGDRALKVENAKSAREGTPQGATNPYTAMQLQQMQQLQLAQMQSSTLAAQVAQLRALAKTNPNAPIATMSANSASQKAAALAAAALLQKKFGQTSGPGNADHAIGKRRSPSADRRNRDRRQDERRQDSGERRQHDSRDRRRSRSRSRERRSERTQASADRRREADRLRESREEHRHSSKGRHEPSHRDSHRDRDRRSSDRRDRSRDRHERSRRDRSAEQRHGRGSRERARSKDRDHRRRPDDDRKDSDQHRSSRRSTSKEADRQKAASADVAGGAVPADSGREAVASDKAAAEPTEPVLGTLHDPSSEATNGHASQVGEKRSRRHADDTLASPRGKSPSRHASQSPVRSPSRHKHSKKHKKEHSHKKSKRDKHSAADRPDDRSEISDLGTTAAAAPENRTQADVSDDLDALRQAALQNTKPTAVQDSVSTDAAQSITADASKAESSAQPEPMDTL